MAWTKDKNGNYKRTIRCGYCYEIGHNKSSCEAKKQMHKDNIAGYEKMLQRDDLTNSDRLHAERHLARHKKQVAKATNLGKHRRCSYCKEEGHTRRTCNHRKADMKTFAKKCLEAREQFVERMVATGFGIGSLGYRGDYYGQTDELTIVESIMWDRVTHEVVLGGTAPWQDIVVSRSITPTQWHPNGKQYYSLLPTAVTNLNNSEEKNANVRMAFRVVSPVDPVVPDDFLTEEGVYRVTKEHAEFSATRPYHYR
jgi:hypothetical protein